MKRLQVGDLAQIRYDIVFDQFGNQLQNLVLVIAVHKHTYEVLSHGRTLQVNKNKIRKYRADRWLGVGSRQTQGWLGEVAWYYRAYLRY